MPDKKLPPEDHQDLRKSSRDACNSSGVDVGDCMDFQAFGEAVKSRLDEEDRIAALSGETIDRTRKPRPLDELLPERKRLLEALAKLNSVSDPIEYDAVETMLDTVDRELATYYGNERVHQIRMDSGLPKLFRTDGSI